MARLLTASEEHQAVGFVVVALIALVIGLIGITQIKKIENADTALYQENTVAGYERQVNEAY
jgi:hypothetical protein